MQAGARSSVVVPFIISTSIAPYEQWLTGGVVMLCDVAPIGQENCCLKKELKFVSKK